MESFRKAYGALKDSTTVGLAKVNNTPFKDLDIAIVKATNHVEAPPNERHVRKIFASVLVSSPRADLGYCIYALSRRLAKTRSWIVAVKTLIVFHRMLREGNSDFKQQLLQFSRRGSVFRISSFRDESNSLAWDCSSWIRAYAQYLEERLNCYRTFQFDVETERMSKSVSLMPKVQSKIDILTTKEKLESLPSLQELLHRLLCCQPEGLASHNFLIQYAFALVVKESFKVYCSINDGIVNLVDTYFEMPRHEAAKALEIYKKAGRQADQLAAFYNFCKTLNLAHTFRFPTLRQPPRSFLTTMEEYIKEAPSKYMRTREEPLKLEYPEEEVKEVETEESMVNSKLPEDDEPEAAKEVDIKSVAEEELVDLLDLREISPEPKQIEEINALALAIIQPGNDSHSTNNGVTDDGQGSGWELALVSQPSNMTKPSQVIDMKMGGGFDKLLLDSLYEDEISRRQLEMQRAGGYTANYMASQNNNPFDIMVPETNMQMAMVPVEEQNTTMMMMPYDPYTPAVYEPEQQQPMWCSTSTNPFADHHPFGSYYYPPPPTNYYGNNNYNHTTLL